jgi:hypothetical protein
VDLRRTSRFAEKSLFSRIGSNAPLLKQKEAHAIRRDKNSRTTEMETQGNHSQEPPTTKYVALFTPKVWECQRLIHSRKKMKRLLLLAERTWLCF